MKKLPVSLLSAFALVALAAPSAFAKSVAIDAGKSSVRWLGKKKLVDSKHFGTIGLKAGTIELDAKNSLKGGKFEIDMASMKNEDLTDAGYNAKLIGHLKNDDFFAVDKHPTSAFVIKSVKPLKGKADATHEITGDLTIKGITHSVIFPAKIEVSGKEAKATGKVIFDRTKYEIRYGSGKFFQNLGDKVIDDSIEIDLDLRAQI
jgi:polyisoprenoid-binding protein YceI